MRSMLVAALVIAAWPLCGGAANAQPQHHHRDWDRKIAFPDIPGYLSLNCDLHMHSVFSDGAVWPDIRVREAIKDGLDAISLTEHLEHQPHSEDIPHPDRNRAHDLATEVAQGSDLIIIRGSEITRSMPPGHANAVFIEDANGLLVDDPVEAFREAKRQGAFVFWDHPHWLGHRDDGVATLTDMHRDLMAEGLLDGIEVVNDRTFSDEALEIALENDLTIVGTSDIHGLVDWRYEVPQGGHRPITLVFAAERSQASIKEALLAGRTVAWIDQLLVGKPEFVVPLVEASLNITEAAYRGDSSVLRIQLENSSSAAYVLRNTSDLNFHNSGGVLDIDPMSTTTLEVKTLDRVSSVQLSFEVMTTLVAPRTHAQIAISSAIANP